MKITTIQMAQTKKMQSQGWMVIDITVKSGDKAFSPSWTIVMGVKNGTTTEEQYTQTYRQMMLSSWKENRARWLEVLKMEKVCLACYCAAPPTFCHRHLLAEYLKKAGATQGIECEIIPEGKKPEQLSSVEEDADGVTHINIYSQGKTELGRDMSNFAHMPVEIEGEEYASLEAYWYSLGTNLSRDDADFAKLRDSSGFEAKRLGRELKKTYGERHDPDFEQKIKNAMWLKVTMYPRLEKALRESTLPLRHYYVADRGDGNRIDAGFAWIVQEWEKIRQELKAPKAPEPQPTKRGITPKHITSLKPGEVFVFGSNGQGFHGAGAAGMAFRGESSNTWREDKAFLAAMNAPKGSPKRVGKWAIFGVSRGYMEGKEGASYAIQTVTKPGAKRSMDLEEILNQLKEMALFAAEHPEMTFLCTITGGGYNGYSVGDMRGVYRSWEDGYPIPMNITFPEEMM